MRKSFNIKFRRSDTGGGFWRWLRAQSNKRQSVQILISEAIYKYGYRDITRLIPEIIASHQQTQQTVNQPKPTKQPKKAPTESSQRDAGQNGNDMFKAIGQNRESGKKKSAGNNSKNTNGKLDQNEMKGLFK